MPFFFLVKIYVRLIPLQSWSVLGFTNLPSDLCETAGTGREREASSAQPPGTLQGEEIIWVHTAPEARDFSACSCMSTCLCERAPETSLRETFAYVARVVGHKTTRYAHGKNFTCDFQDTFFAAI